MISLKKVLRGTALVSGLAIAGSSLFVLQSCDEEVPPPETPDQPPFEPVQCDLPIHPLSDPIFGTWEGPGYAGAVVDMNERSVYQVGDLQENFATGPLQGLFAAAYIIHQGKTIVGDENFQLNTEVQWFPNENQHCSLDHEADQGEQITLEELMQRAVMNGEPAAVNALFEHIGEVTYRGDNPPNTKSHLGREEVFQFTEGGQPPRSNVFAELAQCGERNDNNATVVQLVSLLTTLGLDVPPAEGETSIRSFMKISGEELPGRIRPLGSALEIEDAIVTEYLAGCSGHFVEYSVADQEDGSTGYGLFLGYFKTPIRSFHYVFAMHDDEPDRVLFSEIEFARLNFIDRMICRDMQEYAYNRENFDVQ